MRRLGGQAAGIGSAIPSDTAGEVARQLIQHGRVTTAPGGTPTGTSG